MLVHFGLGLGRATVASPFFTANVLPESAFTVKNGVVDGGSVSGRLAWDPGLVPPSG